MPTHRFLLLVVFAVATGTAGCSSTAIYRRPTTPDEAAKIISEPGSRQVELVVEFPQGPEVRRGTLTPFDANRFVLTETSGQRSSVLFQQTRSISYNNPGKGALWGAVIGAIPGFVFGYAAGSSLGNCHNWFQNSDPSCTSNSFSLGMRLGTTFGLLTGGIGAVIGSFLTYQRTITF